MKGKGKGKGEGGRALTVEFYYLVLVFRLCLNKANGEGNENGKEVGGSGSFTKVGTFVGTRMIRGVEIIMKRPSNSFYSFVTLHR